MIKYVFINLKNVIHAPTWMNLKEFAKSMKPNTKDDTLYDFTYMKCPQ